MSSCARGATRPTDREPGGAAAAVILGGAAQAASTTLRQKVVAVAAHLLEASAEDLEVAGSVVSVRGTPVKAISFAELAGAAYLNPAALPVGMEAGLESSRRFSPPAPFTWSNACHVCVAEVDRRTGHITLERYIVSEDCGVMINPMVVEGQIAGGVVQGIGGVLYEEMAYDDDGNPLGDDVPRLPDPDRPRRYPTSNTAMSRRPSASLGGYKGLGEGGAIASPAAVANAVNDALAPLGARCSVPHHPDPGPRRHRRRGLSGDLPA